MSAKVAGPDRVQIVAPAGVEWLGPKEAEGYTAWCDDLACATYSDDGLLLSMWHGRTHLVGFTSAPNAEAVIDAELHDEERHP